MDSGLNRQYRKVTKTKSVFPGDQSLEKMLYLSSENITKKWPQRYRGWDQAPNRPYSVGIESTARKARSYSRGRVRAEPTKSRL